MVAALLILGGCGGSSGDGTTGGDPSDARGELAWDVATPTPDVPADLGAPDVAAAPDLSTPSDASPFADVTPGEFGAPCGSNEECASGFCAASTTLGYFCTDLCMTADSCLPGWECRQIANPNQDAVFACFPEDDGCAELSPCGDCDAFCSIATVGPAGDDPFLLYGDAGDGVKLDESGVLVLDSESIVLGLKYLWVANSADDTVSQLDTHTGLERGRYSVCDDPSRTAVDLYGNVYVGCRGDDRVAKIIVDPKLCPDRNDDSFIATSRDQNGDGSVTGDEILPLGEDECVAWVVSPLGGDVDATVRGVAVDRFGKPWVGYYEEVPDKGYMLHQLDPATGAVLREVSGLPGGAYGMALDQKGRVWLASRDHGTLVRVDVEDSTPAVSAYTPTETCGDGHTLYGVVVDMAGRVWLGNAQCAFVYRFDPESETWAQFPVDVAGLGYTRGIAADRDGHIVVAHHEWTCVKGRSLSVLDAETGAVTRTIALAEGGVTGPVGVAFDARGFAWAVNQCTNEATKVDLTTGEVVLRQPVGNAPYTYSDMTGYNLRTFVVPSGYYRHVFAGWPQQGTDWRKVDVEAYLPSGAYLDLRVRSAPSVAQLQQAEWSPFLGPFPPARLPYDLSAVPGGVPGDFLEVDVWLFSAAARPEDPPRLEAMQVTYSRQSVEP